MRKRVKDLAYTMKIPKKTLLLLADNLDENEDIFYKTWNEPKLDDDGLERHDKSGNLLTRPICAPIPKLKQIQKKLLQKVLYNLELPANFYGGVKGKDAVMNARHHQGNKYFFLTDLKNFFPSVKHTSLERALRKEGFYPDVARIITRLCTAKGCIPQGCPTSSFAAALVLKHSCSDIFIDLQARGLKASIYVDDVTISSPTDFKDQTMDILNFMRARGLKINFDKTQYCSYNPHITGVQVKNNGICATSKSYKSLSNTSLSLKSRLGHQQRITYINRIAKEGIA